MKPQSRPTLLLTRPQVQSLRFLDEVQARFGPMTHVISPLLVPQVLSPAAAPPSDAVIFTSETGVVAAQSADIWAQSGRPVTAFCVGARTAQAAAQRGYRAISAQGDWRDLLDLILRQMPAGRATPTLTFACAAEAPDHLELALRQAGYAVHRIEVYRQNPAPLLDAARDVLVGSGPVWLPLFSPRSADLFCAAVRAVTAPLHLAALSPAVRRAFVLPCADSVIADRPNSAALLDAMARWRKSAD